MSGRHQPTVRLLVTAEAAASRKAVALSEAGRHAASRRWSELAAEITLLARKANDLTVETLR